MSNSISGNDQYLRQAAYSKGVEGGTEHSRREEGGRYVAMKNAPSAVRAVYSADLAQNASPHRDISRQAAKAPPESLRLKNAKGLEDTEEEWQWLNRINAIGIDTIDIPGATDTEIMARKVDIASRKSSPHDIATSTRRKALSDKKAHLEVALRILEDFNELDGKTLKEMYGAKTLLGAQQTVKKFVSEIEEMLGTTPAPKKWNIPVGDDQR